MRIERPSAARCLSAGRRCAHKRKMRDAGGMKPVETAPFELFAFSKGHTFSNVYKIRWVCAPKIGRLKKVVRHERVFATKRRHLI